MLEGMKLSEIIERMGATPTPTGWEARCPAHDDTNPSLRIAATADGKALMVCRAGCDTRDVLAAKKLTLKDLAGAEVDVEAEYYASESGGPLPLDVAQRAIDTAVAEYPGSPAEEYAKGRWGDVSSVTLGHTSGGLVIPLTDRDGSPIGWQVRRLADNTSGPRWLSPPGGPRMGWVIPTRVTQRTVLVTEGPSDAVAGASQGYACLALLGATGHRRDRVVAELGDWLDRAIMVPDADDAGAHLAASLRLPSIQLTHGDLSSAVQQGVRIRELLEQPARLTAAPPSVHDYRYTDIGAAQLCAAYAAYEGHPIRWAPGVGPLALYGGVWEPVGVAGLRTIVHRAVEYIARCSDQTPQDKDLRSWAQRVQSSSGVDSILKELRALPGVPVADAALDAHPDLLAVRNGVIDLRTGELLPHDPDLMLTKRLPLAYRPDAAAPTWRRLLSEWHPNKPDVERLLQTLAGYGLTGRTSSQVFVVHVGKGSNGKSLFLDTLRLLAGPVGGVTPFSTFEARPNGGIPNDLAALRGLRTVVASEGEAGKRMAEATLKNLTGGEAISARFMRGEFFEFTPQLTLHLATNTAPAFRGQDHGLWRRVVLIPWEVVIDASRRDLTLPQKLEKELTGILAWAVRGAVRWYEEGIIRPEEVDAATQDHREARDDLHGFLGDILIPDPDGEALGADVYRAYRRWHEQEGTHPSEVWTRRMLYGQLRDRGYPQRHSNNGAKFTGLRLEGDDTPWD